MITDSHSFPAKVDGKYALGKPGYFWLAAALIYFSIAFFSLNKPLTMDQAIPTAWNAGAIANYGWDALGDADTDYEVAHPLLYQNLLALSFAVFGESEVAARLVGLLCVLAVLWVIVRLSMLIYSGRRAVAVGGIAALLYAVNPFVVQQSLLVEQQTTVLPLALSLFIYYLYKTDFSTSLKSIFGLSSLFALCIWAKELSPFFLLIALAPFMCFYRGFRQACILTISVGVLGVILFAISWSIYCAATGIDPLSFVEFTIEKKLLNPEYHDQKASFWKFARYTAKWISFVTPAFVLLFLLAAIARMMDFIKRRERIQRIDFIWLYLAVYVFITNVLMYGTLRYQYPLYSMAAIVVSAYVYDLIEFATRRQVIFSIGAGILLAIFVALLITDAHQLKYSHYFLHWVVFPLTLCALTTLTCRVSMLSGKYLGLTAVCFLVTTNLAMGIQQSKPYSTAVSWEGDYGEEGFFETLVFLEENLGSSTPILRKDFGYYLVIGSPNRESKWIYNLIFRANISDDVAYDAILQRDVKYIVLDRYSNRPRAIKLIDPYYSFSRQYGDFDIYERKEFSGTVVTPLQEAE